MKIVDVFVICAAAFVVTALTWTLLDLANDISRQRALLPEKFYTVKTADAIYLDLYKVRNNGNWASYKTTTGKRIVFSGTWVEIEQ